MVREDEHAVAERLQELAAGIEFEDRRLRTAGAGIRSAAMEDEDGAIGCCLDGGYGRPFPAQGSIVKAICG
jgi:hypothetical protein